MEMFSYELVGKRVASAGLAPDHPTAASCDRRWWALPPHRCHHSTHRMSARAPGRTEWLKPVFWADRGLRQRLVRAQALDDAARGSALARVQRAVCGL